MQLLITLSVIFSISFALIFLLVYKGNQKETGELKMGIGGTIFVSFLLALLPTAALGFLFLLLFGAVNTVNMAFTFNINTKQLLTLTIAFFVYLYTIDSLVDIILKGIGGKNWPMHGLLILSRIAAFYVIGEWIGFSVMISLSIAIGVAVIILIMEVLYHFKNEKGEKA